MESAHFIWRQAYPSPALKVLPTLFQSPDAHFFVRYSRSLALLTFFSESDSTLPKRAREFKFYKGPAKEGEVAQPTSTPRTSLNLRQLPCYQAYSNFSPTALKIYETMLGKTRNGDKSASTVSPTVDPDDLFFKIGNTSFFLI
jgi:hypothetical protein